LPGFGGGDFFYAVAVPEASGATEGGKTAFRGDTGAGQNEEAVLGRNPHDDKMLGRKNKHQQKQIPFGDDNKKDNCKCNAVVSG
jgi:hypothetical protein